MRSFPSRAFLQVCMLACAVASTYAWNIHGPHVPEVAFEQLPRDVDERVLSIRDNLYLFAGAESNSVVQVGDDGVLVVDTLREDEADALLRTVRSLSTKPVRYVVNTHGHSSHV